MNIIVAGGRDFKDYNLLRQKLNDLLKDINDVVIISGKANGADSLGEQYGRENNIAIKEFPAKWDLYGKSAGYMRNEEMAKIGDMLIAFWDGKSKGTKHMIDLAKKYNLKTEIIYYNQLGSLYLSSISNIKKIPDNVIKLLITRKPIKNYKKYDIYYVPSLAPSLQLFSEYSSGNKSWKEFVFTFRRDMILNKELNIYLDKVYKQIMSGKNVALICYCSDSDKCHRGIIANYFKELGVIINNI